MARQHDCKDVSVSDSTQVESFQLSEVPEYLRTTAFYSSLEDDGEEITLPRQFFKKDFNISSPTEARDLLSTMRFWGVEKVPSQLILYVAKSSHQDLNDMLSHFAKEIKIVDFLRLLNLELHHIRPSTHKRWIFWESQDFKFKTTVECVVHILAVQFKHECGQIWNKRTAAIAVELGRLDCLTFLHELGCPWGASTSEKAAEYNRLDCLKYAHTHGCPAHTTTKALKKRNMDCFLYARDHGCPCDETTCAAAARLGNLSVLKFAYENGCPWDKSTCTEAATADSLACLKYARERGCPWGASTCAAAAGAGNLAILSYAHEQGCPWDEKTCRNAAYGGHLQCLRYAHEQVCPWDSRTCTAAAFSQSSACLAYAHKNGCPWNEEVIKEATWHGRIECLRYALENGCPGREIACGSVLNSVECLKYLREEQKCPWDVHIVDHFAESLWWYTDCLRYCLQQGCLADENTSRRSSYCANMAVPGTSVLCMPLQRRGSQSFAILH